MGTKLVEAGATYIGGCCGTTPAHIKAIKEALADVSEPIRKTPNPNLALASRSKTVFIGKDLPTRLIGERINPTGRKKISRRNKKWFIYLCKNVKLLNKLKLVLKSLM